MHRSGLSCGQLGAGVHNPGPRLAHPPFSWQHLFGLVVVPGRSCRPGRSDPAGADAQRRHGGQRAAALFPPPDPPPDPLPDPPSDPPDAVDPLLDDDEPPEVDPFDEPDPDPDEPAADPLPEPADLRSPDFSPLAAGLSAAPDFSDPSDFSDPFAALMSLDAARESVR